MAYLYYNFTDHLATP